MPLPNLLIVGAQKSGTTWLHQALRKSAHFQTADQKELNFFSQPDFPAGLEDYKAKLPEGSARYTYESSPSYFRAPKAGQDHARRIAELLPKAEIIVVLRDPVERYLSSYTHHMMKERVAYQPEIDEMTNDCDMLSIGRYGEILDQWLPLLPQTRIYFYDDLQAGAPAFLTRVMGDLGVACDVPDKALRFRVNVKARKFTRLDWPDMPVLSEGLRARLRDYYASDIARLSEITGRDLSTWSG